MKRRPTEREKVSASEATDKGFISKIYKQLLQFYVEKQANPKMVRRSKQTLLLIRKTGGPKAHDKMLNITNY